MVTRILACFLALFFLPVGGIAEPTVDPVEPTIDLPIDRALYFEPNEGQAPEGIAYVGHAKERFILTDDSIFTGNTRTVGEPDPETEPETVTTWMHLRFQGADPERLESGPALGSVSHYYRGDDPDAWVTDVPHVAHVRYVNLYEGIDMVVYSNDGSLEFDHIVAPHAEPNDIRLTFPESTALRVTDDGRLEIEVPGETFHLEAPFAYQQGPTGREPVAATYRVSGDGVQYRLASYDETRPLVIDPVLKVSSYLGSVGSDTVYDTAVLDTSLTTRDVAVAGRTTSATSFPTAFTTTMDMTVPGGWWATSGTDGLLAKYTYDVSTHVLTPVWIAHIGGMGTEYIYGVDIDEDGRVGFAGYTSSSNNPVKDPIVHSPYSMTSLKGTDVMVGYFTGAGVLGKVSFYGGSSTDHGHGFAWLDGDMVIGGRTFSTNFPTINAYQTSRAGSYDAFVARIRTSGPDPIVFSTYIGGSNYDYGWALDADDYGIYLGGYSSSDTSESKPYPVTPGAWDTTTGSSMWSTFAFGTKFTPTGALDFSTYLAGSGSEYVGHSGVAADGSGGFWVGGYTSSWDFPTCPAACVPGSIPPYSSTAMSGYDGFLVHLLPSGTGADYAGFIGGSNSDYIYGVGVNGKGQVAVAGQTTSGDYPTTPSATSATKLGSMWSSDSVITTIDLDTGALRYSSYLGGLSTDYLYAIAGDGYYNFYFGGETYSYDIPILDAPQPVRASFLDAHVGVIGKETPYPVLTAHSIGYPSLSTISLDSYKVLTFETIRVEGLNSTAGLYPIDPTKTKWELFAEDGTLIRTVVGALDPDTLPGWTTLYEEDDTIAKACLNVYDTDPDPIDRLGRACMELEWLNRPPVPVIESIAPNPTCTGQKTDFLGSATDKDGVVDTSSYIWKMGPFGYRFGPSTSFSFPFGFDGTYTITLTAVDDDGATGTTTMDLVVQDGPYLEFVKPAPTLPGQAAVFEDQTKPSVDDRVPIEWWRWDFGDGSQKKVWQNPYLRGYPYVSHVYEKEGFYTVTLEVSDRKCASSLSKVHEVLPHGIQTQPDIYSTYGDVDLVVDAPGVLANDKHPMGYDKSVSLATGPSNGALSLASDGSFVYDPDPTFLGTDSFTYMATDGLKTVGPVTVTIQVNTVPPPDAVFATEVRGLVGIFWDQSVPGHHPIVQYEWDFGDSTGATVKDAVHKYNEPGTYTVTLTVTDGTPSGGLMDSTTRSIYVTPLEGQPEVGSDPPVAKPAAPSTVRPKQTVAFDGTASIGGPVLDYEWRQVAGPPTPLAGANTPFASFVAPDVQEPTELAFELVVHNTVEPSLPERVTVMVQGRNAPPEIQVPALRQSVPAGTSSPLVATTTDADGDPVKVTWRQVAGPPVELQGEGTGARFEAPQVDAPTGYVFEVTADDGIDKTTARTELQVLPDATTPVARFDSRLLDATKGLVSFDADVQAERFIWDFGDGSLPSHHGNPVHGYERSGNYEVTLTVFEGTRYDTITRPLEVNLVPPTVPMRQIVEVPVAEPEEEGPVAKSIPVPFLLAFLALALMAWRSRK